MDNFKKILELEKKYNLKVSKIKKSSLKNLELKKEEIIIQSEAFKENYYKELKLEFKRRISKIQKKAKEIENQGIVESEKILNSARINETKDFIINAIKNV